MAQVGECYYIPYRDELYLIEEVQGTHVIATVITKEINILGYHIYHQIFRYTNFFIGIIKLDPKVFYKICKLLELNCRNCSLLLDRADTLDDSPFSYYLEPSCVTLFYGKIMMTTSPDYLFMTDDLTYCRKIFINEETFNKANNSCLATISAIDEIWAQFK